MRRAAFTGLFLCSLATACAVDDTTILYLGAVERDAAPSITARPDATAPGWLSADAADTTDAGAGADATDAGTGADADATD